MVTEGKLSEVKQVMEESLNLHRVTQTATTVNWCYMAHERSHYKSSELISEGMMYLSNICLVMFGFIVLSFQTFLQQISQISKFSLDVS